MIPSMGTRGLEPVPDSQRTGRVRALFPAWVGANPTVLPLTIGAGLVVFDGQNLRQVLTVALAALAIGFGPVGPISLAGRSGGAPGMAPSRTVFGPRGNLPPGGIVRVPAGPGCARRLPRSTSGPAVVGATASGARLVRVPPVSPADSPYRRWPRGRRRDCS